MNYSICSDVMKTWTFGIRSVVSHLITFEYTTADAPVVAIPFLWWKVLMKLFCLIFFVHHHLLTSLMVSNQVLNEDFRVSLRFVTFFSGECKKSPLFNVWMILKEYPSLSLSLSFISILISVPPVNPFCLEFRSLPFGTWNCGCKRELRRRWCPKEFKNIKIFCRTFFFHSLSCEEMTKKTCTLCFFGPEENWGTDGVRNRSWEEKSLAAPGLIVYRWVPLSFFTLTSSLRMVPVTKREDEEKFFSRFLFFILFFL